MERVIDPKYHVRLSTGEIVKTSNGVVVPEDEPVILFRARDRMALPALLAYRRLCLDDGCNEHQIESIGERIRAFDTYAGTHPETMKQPGSTRGA